MKLSADLLAFQARIGHVFRNPELLVRAVTHASISSANRPDNQRLEFLGDRVLGLVMAEALLSADVRAAEGQLAPRFNALVRKETCAEVAREVGLARGWHRRFCLGWDYRYRGSSAAPGLGLTVSSRRSGLVTRGCQASSW